MPFSQILKRKEISVGEETDMISDEIRLKEFQSLILPWITVIQHPVKRQLNVGLIHRAGNW